MWWHADAYRMIGLVPSVDPAAAAAIDALERRTGRWVPPAVREWYSVEGALEWFADHTDNGLVTADELGEPVGDVDYLGNNWLVVETDSQFCCHWAVRLSPPASDGEALFPSAAGLNEDPPVSIIDPDDPDPVEDLYSERFTTYVRTSIWTAQLLAGDAFYADDHPLPDQALATLRGRYTELPKTHAWAGNQSADTVHRFTGTARIMIAVENGTALYLFADAGSPQELAEIQAVLGL